MFFDCVYDPSDSLQRACCSLCEVFQDMTTHSDLSCI